MARVAIFGIGAAAVLLVCILLLGDGRLGPVLAGRTLVRESLACCPAPGQTPDAGAGAEATPPATDAEPASGRGNVVVALLTVGALVLVGALAWTRLARRRE